MMIRTKLKIVIYLCVTLGVISGIAVFYSFRHMEQKLQERREIHAIVRGVFDLTVLADEYLLYHEKRPLEQWNRIYNSLSGLIDGARDPSHRAYLVGLKDDYKDLKVLFSRLIVAYKNPMFKDDLELSQQLESHRQSQILAKNQELVTRSDRLQERAERELLTGQKRIGRLIFGIIVAVSVSIIGLTLFIRKGVVLPFESLIEVAESIGKGNLDVRIETKARDEIGELSRTFDQMVSRLKVVMVSRTSLQEEVTHRKRAEEELKKERDFISAILSTAGAMVVVLDREGRIVRFNRACEKLTGYSFDEVEGIFLWNRLLLPEEKQSVIEVFDDLKAGKFPNISENRWISRAGEHRLITWANTALVDEEGRVEYVIGTGIDITEKREAEKAVRDAASELERRVEERTAEIEEANRMLKGEIEDRKRLQIALTRSEKRFRVFMDHAPTAIYLKDESLKFIYGNRTVLDYLGVTLDQFVGKTSHDYFPPDIANSHEEDDKKVLDQGMDCKGAPWKAEVGVETRWWFDIKFPVDPETQEHLVGGISVDISELKRSEQALEERLEFEKLLAGLASRLLNVTVPKFQATIREELTRLGEFLEVDQVLIFEIEGGQTASSKSIGWRRKGIETGGFSHEDTGDQHFPWIGKKALEGGAIAFSTLDEIPQQGAEELEYFRSVGIKSLAVIPLCAEKTDLGLLVLDTFRSETTWSEDFMGRLVLIGEIFTSVLARKQGEEVMQRIMAENQELRERLKAENIYLKQEITLSHSHENIIGQSEAIKDVLSLVEQVAKTKSLVLIQGETGTGKELIAQAIHSTSSRRDKTMVKVNCAALPPTLIENELFGREKGAYTGAFSRQMGRFEIANGSTLFLDEIGEMPIELQGKLLRVLEEGQFERLGSTSSIKVDVRMIAATNRDLTSAIKEGRFREDLFYRLNVFPIHLPPLRDRREDIPELIWAFIKEFERSMGKSVNSISQKSMKLMQSYSWPGNVREMRNVIERMMILCQGDALHIDLPSLEPGAASPDGMSLEQTERKHILSVLEQIDWRVGGQNGAAEILGLKRTTLLTKMKKLGIQRPKK